MNLLTTFSNKVWAEIYCTSGQKLRAVAASVTLAMILQIVGSSFLDEAQMHIKFHTGNILVTPAYDFNFFQNKFNLNYVVIIILCHLFFPK